jgi:two-component system, chemotaxis family, protein-glutamate methylesterase/glutaminase
MASSNDNAQIQVLVVDDSAVVRQVMHAVLSQEGDMNVTVAADPIFAMQKMKQVRPHVIVLDLEMPRMDGLTFLRKIMAEDPIPTLICSSVAARGTLAAIKAMQDGAVGIVTKPKLAVGNFLHESAVMLIDAVRSAAAARMRRRARLNVEQKSKMAAPRVAAESFTGQGSSVIAIGASTGGTEAISTILTAMPKESPGIVVVQHMPEHFTAAFAKWLDNICEVDVKEAEQGDVITQGKVFIAPGNRQLSIFRLGAHYRIRTSDGPLVSRHRPSVNFLFRSVAKTAGSDALGVILTGMGDDGAEGLFEMRQAGAHTIAQDEASCVVFGMPKEAISCGAVAEVLPLESIATTLINVGMYARRAVPVTTLVG